MSKKNYKTTRNKQTISFYRIKKINYQEENSRTIKSLFTKECIEKMTEWEKSFITNIKQFRTKWSEKQLAVLKKIKKKYENNQTKN